MALIVHKYGGTSLGDIDLIRSAADKVIAARKQGHQVVAVVSAMSGETNRLLKLAHEISSRPDNRELDVLLSTGEQVSIALLTHREEAARLVSNALDPISDIHASAKYRKDVAGVMVRRTLEQALVRTEGEAAA